jgi:hypothetical protein
MKRFSKDMNRLAAVLTCATLAGCGEQPTRPDDASDWNAPLFAPKPGRGGQGGGQATYEYTFSGDIQSAAFLATASSKDPFARVDIVGALRFPEGNTLGCGLGLDPNPPFAASDWDSYPGWDFTGSLQFSGPRGKNETGGAVSLFADADSDRFMNLDVQVWDMPAIEDDQTSTLTFIDHIALVGEGSHPPGGAVDPRDRCVTFTITAVRQ